MLINLKYVLLLVSIASRLLAFSSEDIAEGRVKKIDLPGGHLRLVPHYFEVEQLDEGNSIAFQSSTITPTGLCDTPLACPSVN